MKPAEKPSNPFFSSGPCSKPPGWTLDKLAGALLGRSHRSVPGKKKFTRALDLTRKVLQIPEDYRIAIVPASDTGAMEIAMWSLLGQRGVDILAWESFGKGWVNDVVKELKLNDVNQLQADYGKLPNLAAVNFQNDVVFVWNGTTSGVKVPDGEWIEKNREGLTICDATSAAFAMDLPWKKLDVTTYSWQKVLGGEAAHGVLILSPRAVQRLETWTPPWPMPKLFRLTKEGRLNDSIFAGSTINTPSMLCVEDYLTALEWAESVGGLAALIDRSEKNLAAVEGWVKTTHWIDFLAEQSATRSNTSVCLRIIETWFTEKSRDEQSGIIRQLTRLLENENAGFDIEAYRDAPPGIRIWCGATVETRDVERLMPWIDWAYSEIKRGDA